MLVRISRFLTNSILAAVVAVILSSFFIALSSLNRLTHAATPADSQPNILLIRGEHLGFYDLGAFYSSQLKLNKVTTPVADGILLPQNAGIILSKFQAAVPVVNLPADLENHTIRASPEEAAFLAENDAAMKKMMAAMDINASGDVDRDFVAMMLPHHQAAIDMSQSELLYGDNEQLRRIAQGIIIEQQQEIVAMQLALNQSSLSSLSSPDQSCSYANQTNTLSPHLTLTHLHRGES
jgi:Domain of unknown function (DUF305)